MILAIETSDILCSVAFRDEGRTLIEYNVEMPMQHATLVGSLVQKGLRFLAEPQTGRPYRLQDISALAVALGPGSFTGLRIGLSFAQGFCFANSLPIVGISNHQVLAARAAQPADKVYTLIEARKSEVYLAQIIGVSESNPEVGRHQIAKKDDLAEIIEPGSQLITAANVSLEQDIIKRLIKQDNIIHLKRSYSAGILARAGQKKLMIEGADDLSQIEPLYIRPFAGVL